MKKLIMIVMLVAAAGRGDAPLTEEDKIRIPLEAIEEFVRLRTEALSTKNVEANENLKSIYRSYLSKRGADDAPESVHLEASVWLLGKCKDKTLDDFMD